MRDLIVLAIVFGSLPFCFFRPHIGILVFSWLAYMNPHRLSWGAAFHFPVANYVGLALLLGVPFAKDRQSFPVRRESVLLVLLWLLFTLTSATSVYPESAWRHWELVSKILLITMVTIVFFQDRVRLKWLLLTISLSVGFFGVKGAVFAIITGGAHRVYGPLGTFLEDNNDLALALVMVLPILYFLALQQKTRIYRWSLFATTAMCAAAIVFTYSRGGFLGLAAVAGVFLLRTKHRVLAILLLLALVATAYTVVPEKWFERMGTISEFEEDRSALGRINAWGFAWNLALDRPFTGGGFNCFTPGLFLSYAPEPWDYHDAHSVYFELLAEHGFPATIVFLVLIFSILLRMRRLKRRFVEAEETRWIAQYAEMLTMSFVGYLVCGAFLGRAYFDLMYQLVAVAIVLLTLADREEERQRVEAEQAVQADEAEGAEQAANSKDPQPAPDPSGAPA